MDVEIETMVCGGAFTEWFVLEKVKLLPIHNIADGTMHVSTGLLQYCVCVAIISAIGELSEPTLL